MRDDEQLGLVGYLAVDGPKLHGPWEKAPQCVRESFIKIGLAVEQHVLMRFVTSKEQAKYLQSCLRIMKEIKGFCDELKKS